MQLSASNFTAESEGRKAEIQYASMEEVTALRELVFQLVAIILDKESNPDTALQLLRQRLAARRDLYIAAIGDTNLSDTAQLAAVEVAGNLDGLSEDLAEVLPNR